MTPLLLEKALTAPDGGRSAAGMDAELLTSTRNECLCPFRDTAFPNMEGKGVTGLTRYSQ